MPIEELAFSTNWNEVEFSGESGFDPDSPSTATGLSRSLLAQRKRSKLTQEEVARRVGQQTSQINEYELGRERPRESVLRKLGQALGKDFVGTFPYPGTTPSALARPANQAGRLYVLIKQVADGKIKNLASWTGISNTSLGLAVSGRTPLTEERLQRLFNTLPTLNQAWLRRGKGQAFPDESVPPIIKTELQKPVPLSEVPTPRAEVPPVAAAATPTPKPAGTATRKKKLPPHPNTQGMRVSEQKEIKVFDQLSLTGGITWGTLEDKGLPLLRALTDVLGTLTWHQAGLTPEQLRELHQQLLSCCK